MLRRELPLAATYSASAIVASMLTNARRTAAVALASVVVAILVGYVDDETAGSEWLLRAWLGVGGDLYEVAQTPYGVRLIVGDVKGKGIEAARVAASVLSAFRHAAAAEPDVGAVASAGHPAPLLLVGHSVTELDPPEHALPLGMGADPVLLTHDWPPGARLLPYTDGLVEARDRRGRFFPLDDHVDGLSNPSLDLALDHLVDQLVLHVGAHVDDDLALVLAEHRP